MRRLLAAWAAVLLFAASSHAALRVVLAGPPASGKSTQSALIQRDYGAVPVPVGKLLRAAARRDPALKAVMDRGALVEAPRVVGLVERRLSRPDVRKKGFILDGFPRRAREAEAFRRMPAAAELDAIVILRVPERELRRRSRARGRDDDGDATFSRRLSLYERRTLPALHRLRGLAPVLKIDASGSPAQVHRRIRLALDGLFQ